MPKKQITAEDLQIAMHAAAHTTQWNKEQLLQWRLFDLSSDLKMLEQLLKEKEVGFPTPQDEEVPLLMIIETAEEHLGYLASRLGQDPSCPPPKEMHPLYPYGEGRMSEEEYEQRRSKKPSEHVCYTPIGEMYRKECAVALNRGDADAAEGIIAEARADNVTRQITAEGEDVLLFNDGSWFDIRLCFET